MLNIFSYAYFLSAYYLWWSVCLGLAPIFTLSCLFPSCWALKVFCIFWILVLHQTYVLNRFPPIYGLSLCSLNSVSQRAENFYFNNVRPHLFFFFFFFLLGIALLVLYLKTHHQTQVHTNFLLSFLQEFL